MRYWKRLSHLEQDIRITEALRENIDYKQKVSLGIPASKLDPNVFYDQASFLKDAPLLRAYVQNPNHIGCHTMGSSETFFKGTQELEKEVIELLAVDFFKAEEESCDGYIASGGTEANIQAVWIYRNYFIRSFNARQDDIAILCSEDTHYSIAKAANLLDLSWYPVAVDKKTRELRKEAIDEAIGRAVEQHKKYFIVIANMGTTMFGSIDDPDVYAKALTDRQLSFKLHVDGAFGGFIYPVSQPENCLNFSNPYVSSITLDAHKMLQAPYGTGIFVARKGLMEYVYTKQARYVQGMDLTLIGSRSGANAVAVWMILFHYGPFGWLEKVNKLLYRTNWCCRRLQELGIAHYRHARMNIITIPAAYIAKEIAAKYGLVPDRHDDVPDWYKIVIMDHVELEHLEEFIEELQQACVQLATHVVV